MTDQSTQMRWNFARLYTSADDPQIEADMTSAVEAAHAFRSRYRTRIEAKGLTSASFGEALSQYESLQKLALKPYHYAYLLFAADSEPEKNKRLLSRVREVLSEVTESTLFFDLEILRIEEQKMAQFLQNPEVSCYSHYLSNLRAAAPYALAEEVEQVIKRKDLSGKDAFVQLFDETTSSLKFRFRLPGADQETDVTGEDLLALLYQSDRQVREDAFSLFLNTHAEKSQVLTSCFNNLLLDHGREAELRGYPELMTPTHLSSETEPEMVRQMMAVTEQNYGLAQRYFGLKKRLLKLDSLKNTDLYAPVAQVQKVYNYPEACQLVLQSFASFSQQLAAEADRIMQAGHVDVFPRPGKSGGAFCMGMLPEATPYVLLNFTGNLRDVSTLAHELGHAVHYSLSRKQNLFHYHAPLPLAETASVFGEMLLTRTLLEQETDRELKIALLSSKLEDMIATTFRQNVLTRFELAAHTLRGERLLSADDLCRLWLEENGKLFGEHVQMIDAYRWGWSYISHFIHARFYCYSYVFGELLVLALYQLYLDQDEGFVPLYHELLKSGGSAPPAELVSQLGLDLNDPEFWQGGYDFMSALLDELEALINAE
jgi:oligoendopeptidase F